MKTECPDISIDCKKLNGKPIYTITVNEVINFKSAFDHKLLCTGPTFSLGSACAYMCSFCYVESVVQKHPEVQKLRAELDSKGLQFEQVVIVRNAALDIMREQLTIRKPRNVDLQAPGVIFSSPLVDPSPNMQMALQTAQACCIVLELTNWDIRLLSKSNLLPEVAKKIPEKFKHRLIYGVSTGTLDNKLAKAFEQGTALVSKRLESLHWLQDNGYRTYGMICPSLPQEDYDGFTRKMAEAIRVDRCEHVWGEVINLRGRAISRTHDALKDGGFPQDAERLLSVCANGKRKAWEQYARDTFEALTRHIPPEKLRFLQYVKRDTADWWNERRPQGAVLLGAAAEQ